MTACCPLFAALFREVSHVGSSYDKLRLDQAGDFDLNFVLDIDVLINNELAWLEMDDIGTAGFANLMVDKLWLGRVPSNHRLYK